jgi:uncharacterized protein with HEPN domain
LPLRHDPADSLTGIIDNAGQISDYVEGMDEDAFEQNRLVRDAVERCLERICEATYRLGDQAESFLPGQPIRLIRGMGNLLRHGYDRINVGVVWSTVRDDLPGLVNSARQALARLQATQDKGSGPRTS